MEKLPRCRHCGAEHAPGQAYCGTCGTSLALRDTSAPTEGDDVIYCYRHKREPTLLRCGKCDVPICTKCAIIGPAGVRCPVCGRNRIPMRPRGLLHDVGTGVGSAIGRVG